jgi:hypothetical protein
VATTDTGGQSLPSIRDLLAPVLARVAPDRHALLIALAERMAAERYRAWAAAPENAGDAPRLLACAARELDIAKRVEALYQDAVAIQHELRAAVPELEEIDRALFAGRSRAEQFAIQASGERLGAATWRALASRETDPTRAAVLRSCAPLEEDSAAVLETILGRGA